MEQLLDVHRGQPKRRPSDSRHSRQADAAREEGGDKAPSDQQERRGRGAHCGDVPRGDKRAVEKHKETSDMSSASPALTHRE